MSDSTRLNVKVIFALFLVHFMGDFYSAFVRPLLPVLAEKHNLSLGDVGLISGVFSLLAFVVQPIVGYMADRYRTRFFMLGGAFLAIVCIPFIGVANAFWMLLLLVALGSTGSSMFHPQAAGLIPVYSGHRTGFAMSLFWVGGATAFGIGPVVATYWVEIFSLEALPWLSVFGLAGMVALFFILPVPEPEQLKSTTFISSLKEIFAGVVKPLILLWLVIMLRSFVNQSLMTYMPMLASQLGYSLVAIGFIVSCFVASGSVSGMVAGWMADRVGFKKVVIVTLLISVPCLLAFTNLTGDWIYVGGVAAGLTLLASMPLTVAMAQKIVPKGRSMVSSLMMGFAFGIGGMLTPVTGYVAEYVGIKPTLTALSLLPLVMVVCIAGFPEKRLNNK